MMKVTRTLTDSVWCSGGTEDMGNAHCEYRRLMDSSVGDGCGTRIERSSCPRG